MTMVRAEIYKGDKAYILGNGQVGTLEVVQALYPAILAFPHVVITDEQGECFLACDPLSRRKAQLNIDPNSSVEDALSIIEAIENTPQIDPSELPPSAEERIAAAMEFQNLMML